MRVGGFKQGDIVELEVDRSACSVKYFVNGAYKAIQSNKMLADDRRIFMPLVEFYYTNDAVEWLI